MRPYFKPLPGLTFITLIMLSILIGLGTWQYKRLGWKTTLLAEIDQAANALPLTSLAQVAVAIADNEPLDFRRIEIAAEYLPFEQPFRVYQKRDDNYGWRLFVPIRQDDFKTFAALDTIDDGEAFESPEPAAVMLAGYVRIARDKKPRTKSTPEQNRWFGFDPMPETNSWAAKVADIDVRYYLDIEPGLENAENLPVKYPQVRNNHLEYMITWYSLALILLIYYVLMHRREGRAGWS